MRDADADGHLTRKEVLKTDGEKKIIKKKKADSEKNGKTKIARHKKKLFGSVQECEVAIEKYFDTFLTESGEVADIESLADYLGITRDEMFALMSDKKFGKALRLARNRIAKIKKQLAFGGKIPAAVLSFDLKNNHGYRDKPDDGEGNHNNEQVIFKGKAADWAE